MTYPKLVTECAIKIYIDFPDSKSEPLIGCGVGGSFSEIQKVLTMITEKVTSQKSKEAYKKASKLLNTAIENQALDFQIFNTQTGFKVKTKFKTSKQLNKFYSELNEVFPKKEFSIKFQIPLKENTANQSCDYFILGCTTKDEQLQFLKEISTISSPNSDELKLAYSICKFCSKLNIKELAMSSFPSNHEIRGKIKFAKKDDFKTFCIRFSI